MKRILLSEKIKKAPPFLTIEPYLRSHDEPVASHPEARKWLQQKLSEEEQPPQAELTFGEYLLEWFENHSSQIKESTQCDYEIIIHKYILPELRHVVLNTLHRSVFDKYYTNLRKIPAGDTQIR